MQQALFSAIEISTWRDVAQLRAAYEDFAHSLQLRQRGTLALQLVTFTTSSEESKCRFHKLLHECNGLFRTVFPNVPLMGVLNQCSDSQRHLWLSLLEKTHLASCCRGDETADRNLQPASDQPLNDVSDSSGNYDGDRAFNGEKRLSERQSEDYSELEDFGNHRVEFDHPYVEWSDESDFYLDEDRELERQFSLHKHAGNYGPRENTESDGYHGGTADLDYKESDEEAAFLRPFSDDESGDDDMIDIGYNDYDECYFDLITMFISSTEG